jgi:ketosteroid isomerase-like protein
MVQVAALVAITALGISCEDRRMDPKGPGAREVHGTGIETAVRSLLERWVQAFTSRDVAAIRSILSSKSSFVWLEDGETRYRSSAEIASALESFATGMSFATSLEAVSVFPVSNSTAWAHFSTKTTILHGEQIVANFDGVVLMLFEHEQGEWKIAAAHTSTNSPRQNRGQ